MFQDTSIYQCFRPVQEINHGKNREKIMKRRINWKVKITVLIRHTALSQCNTDTRQNCQVQITIKQSVTKEAPSLQPISYKRNECWQFYCQIRNGFHRSSVQVVEHVISNCLLQVILAIESISKYKLQGHTSPS